MIEPVERVHIELRSVKPSVWRRVYVPLSATLAALHDIIQVTMGWTDSHLHGFVDGGPVCGPPGPDHDFADRRVYRESDEVFERIYIGRRFRNDSERLEKLFDLYTRVAGSEEMSLKKRFQATQVRGR